MSSNSIFESFLTSQGYALFESLDNDEFLPLGDCPAWCRNVFELQTPNAKRIRLADSPFLENFLIEAEDFWNSKAEVPV